MSYWIDFNLVQFSKSSFYWSQAKIFDLMWWSSFQWMNHRPKYSLWAVADPGCHAGKGASKHMRIVVVLWTSSSSSSSSWVLRQFSSSLGNNWMSTRSGKELGEHEWVWTSTGNEFLKRFWILQLERCILDWECSWLAAFGFFHNGHQPGPQISHLPGTVLPI